MTRTGTMPVTAALIMIFLTLTAMAQERPSAPALEVDEYAFCREVVDRQPFGAAESFPADIGRVYLWTQIMNPGAETVIAHVWYYGETKMFEISLDINYRRTRTWSSKTILPIWTGQWRVDVVDAGSNVLGSYKFTIDRPEE